MEAVLRGGRSSREGELCVQAIFSLLDTVRLWLEDTRPALLSAAGTSTSALFGNRTLPTCVQQAHLDSCKLLCRMCGCKHLR